MLKQGQRLEDIVYFCDERKQLFKRKVIINDELELRRKLCGVVLLLKLAWNGHKYLLLRSVDGRSPRFIGTGSKSVPGYLYGPEYASAKRTTENIWDLSREAYGIKQTEPQDEATA